LKINLRKRGKRQMSEQPHWVVSLIISWLPFIVFCLTGWWLGHQVRQAFRTKDGRSLADVLDELSHQLKQSNTTRSSN
jgi:hypothetical protein